MGRHGPERRHLPDAGACCRARDAGRRRDAAHPAAAADAEWAVRRAAVMRTDCCRRAVHGGRLRRTRCRARTGAGGRTGARPGTGRCAWCRCFRGTGCSGSRCTRCGRRLRSRGLGCCGPRRGRGGLSGRSLGFGRRGRGLGRSRLGCGRRAGSAGLGCRGCGSSLRTRLVFGLLTAGFCAERFAQSTRNGRLHCGGRRLHELALLLELGQEFLAGDTEFLRQLVHAGLTCCHYISSSGGNSGGRRRASGLAMTHGHRDFTVCSCSSLPVLLPGHRAVEIFSDPLDVLDHRG